MIEKKMNAKRQFFCFAPYLLVFLLTGQPIFSADPRPTVTKQRVYVISEVELLDGCKMFYSTTTTISTIGCSYMPKEKTLPFGCIADLGVGMKTELIVFPDRNGPVCIAIPSKSIPASDDILIRLRADYTITVTPLKRGSQ